MSSAPTLETLFEAGRRIAPYVRRTPVLTSRTLDERCGGSLFFKCENFQRGGAFKFRGACNAVLSLPEEDAAKGVVTHSSGNHGQALALAAQLRGIKAYIVMPGTAPGVKKAAVAGYGAEITFCESSLESRERCAARIIEEKGAILVHPYNDYQIIAGQGTAALELLEEVPDLDVLVTPVGGGGLLSGTALAAKGLSPRTQVVGVEPEGADDAYRSFQAGKILPMEAPDTIADGLLASLGDKTFPIIRDHVGEIVTVSDPDIIEAMRLMWERMKIVVEASAAVPLAALLHGALKAEGKRIGVIVSGGNVDLDALPWRELKSRNLL
ncbi:MAG: pyridoxal-phosphate dependent enzyme [Candidatus Hydrogenedentes bacterium]|nr:pyridoxal-phosphate dependent enzyme [Candidatus Hydrogenedentota bacterium]